MTCFHCSEEVTAADKQASLSDGQTMHLECSIRMVLGSAAHQMRECPCYGGAREELGALTKRQDAMNAYTTWRLLEKRRSKAGQN